MLFYDPVVLGRPGRRRRLRGARGRGTLATEKPPVLGLIQRNGEVVLTLLPNVQQATIKPVIIQSVEPGSRLFTDEYDIYHRLPEWGYEHKTVNHSKGEYARDEDGDGFHEVHVNTMEGCWSLLRPGCVRTGDLPRETSPPSAPPISPPQRIPD